MKWYHWTTSLISCWLRLSWQIHCCCACRVLLRVFKWFAKCFTVTCSSIAASQDINTRSNQASRSTKCRFRGLSGTRTVRVMDFNSPIEGSGLISKCVISCGGRKQVASRHFTFWANNLKPFCSACCWLTVVVCPLLINVCVLCAQCRHSLYLPWTELNTSQAQQFCGQHSFSLQSQMELSQKRLSWRRDHAATAQVRTCVALGMCPRRGQ